MGGPVVGPCGQARGQLAMRACERFYKPRSIYKQGLSK
jgi:hypothetical protein